jgi:hypothetical protein
MDRLWKPRALEHHESRILRWLLEADFEGVDALRKQAETVRVKSKPCECGCPTIDLLTARDAPRAPQRVPFHDLVVEATTPDAGNAEEFFELLLFVKAGRLALLELVTFTDNPPSEFPPPSVFEPPTVN